MPSCGEKERTIHKYCIIQHLADAELLLRAVVDKPTLVENTPGVLNLAALQEMFGLLWPY